MKQLRRGFTTLSVFFALLLSVQAAIAMTPAIDRGAVWKYDDTGTDLGTSWSDTLFDDSAWPSGPGPLGYGETYIATTIDYGVWTNKYPTSYFRHKFTVSDNPATIQYLYLESNFDDGYVAYLNGTEVARRSLPAGPILYTTYASLHEGGMYEPIDISAFIPLLNNDTNTFAIELHQASAASSDFVWDGELWYSTAPALASRGPYLQVGSPTGVTIRWRSNVATDSRIRYGTSVGSLSSSVTDAVVTTEHEITLSGLLPGTRYYYAYGATTYDLDGDDADHYFDTSPVTASQSPVRIWVIGDSGEANQNATDVYNAYRNHPGADNTDVWLMLGDNAYNSGTDAEYQAAVFDMYPEMLRNTVLWSTRGNHDDIHAGANNDYYEIFTMPTLGESGGLASGTEAYYSFDYANIHFVCLDSDGTSPFIGQPQMNWFEADLAATSQDWVIVFWHHPPYTKGSHDSDNPLDSGGRMTQMRLNAVQVIANIGGDLVLGGHSHAYERSFLLDGHYGTSGALVDSNRIDIGDGSESGDGPYVKLSLGTAPHEGSVFSVVGSSAKLGGGSLDHPVMLTSLNVLGSMVIDIEANRLDAAFIDDNGIVLDEFTIIKGIDTGTPSGERPTNLFFGFGSRTPNPMRDQSSIAFHIPASGRANVSIFDVSGRLVRELVDTDLDAGVHETSWDGRNSAGRAIAAGTYFSVLHFGGETRSRKITLVR